MVKLIMTTEPHSTTIVREPSTKETLTEKSWRTISTDKYVIAGIITALIFALGLTLGFILEDTRYGLIQKVNEEQEVKYMSLQLQYFFLTSFQNNNSCPMLTATLRETISDLSTSLSEVIAYEEENQGGDARRILVQRRYLMDNLRYWLLAKESKQRCSMNIVPILYFYKKDCASCPEQGTILTFYKNLFEEMLLVFPINMDLQEAEPLAEIMRSQHHVEQYPTIVVDDQKYEGVVDKDEMKKIICRSLPKAPQCQN